MRNPLKIWTANPLDEPLAAIADDAEVQALIAERAALWRRLEQANDRLDVARARANRAARPVHGVTEMARRMVLGATIPAYDPEDDVRAALDEQDILNEAIMAIQPRMEEIVYQRSLVVAERFREPYREGLRAIFRAMVDMHQAIQSCHAIRVKLIIAGYKVSNVGLPDFHLKSALVLGDPFGSSTYTHEAAAFRARLEQWGVDTQ